MQVMNQQGKSSKIKSASKVTNSIKQVQAQHPTWFGSWVLGVFHTNSKQKVQLLFQQNVATTSFYSKTPLSQKLSLLTA